MRILVNMKTLAIIFIINAVEVMVENITPATTSTTPFIAFCPKDCDITRLWDRNCLSCFKVESTDIEEEKMSGTSSIKENKMSCLYWQQVCINDCSKKEPTAENPPTAYEKYICEEKCKVDWFCFAERYDAEHNQRRLFDTSNSIN